MGLLFLVFQASNLLADQLKSIPTAIHMHSHVSSGAKSISEMAEIAQQQHIQVMIITDLYWEHYEYGVPLLRKLFKKNFDRKSIFQTGINQYLEQIRTANTKYPGLTIIDGAAVTPFYFWSGNLYPGPLVLNNRAKDMLIFGFDSEEPYKNLPTMGNASFNFDPYSGDAYSKPYQQFIDYVKAQNGFVFWSHPGANEHIAINDVFLGLDVYLDTPPYQDALLSTFRYDGFGVFPTDLSMIHANNHPSAITPGSYWDKVLREYCNKKRETPAWAIGEADYNGFPNGIKDMDGILNMVLAPSQDQKYILSAIKRGKLYVIIPASHTERIILDEFSVADGNSETKATMGENLSLNALPLIHIRGHLSEDNESPRVHILLIKDTRVIAEWNESFPFDVRYQDLDNIKPGKSYYRILCYSENSPHRLLSNPIFTERK